MRARAPIFLSLIAAGTALAESNVHPDHKMAWGENIGWIDWSATPVDGARIDRNVASGFLYSQNAGWINLGSGTPENGRQYSNSSASDFGVNVGQDGSLRGFAYGANIGWISFEEKGSPQLDFTTGRLSGFAYGANIGWITLAHAETFIQVELGSAENDEDNDGIPDDWEMQQAGNLTLLSESNDADSDGMLDIHEFHSDTDPRDPNSLLEILLISPDPITGAVNVSWTARPTRNYVLQISSALGPDAVWTDASPEIQSSSSTTISHEVNQPPGGSNQFFIRVRAIRPAAR